VLSLNVKLFSLNINEKLLYFVFVHSAKIWEKRGFHPLGSPPHRKKFPRCAAAPSVLVCGKHDHMISLAVFSQVPPSVWSLFAMIGTSCECPIICPIRGSFWEAPIGSFCRRRWDLCEYWWAAALHQETSGRLTSDGLISFQLFLFNCIYLPTEVL